MAGIGCFARFDIQRPTRSKSSVPSMRGRLRIGSKSEPIEIKPVRKAKIRWRDGSQFLGTRNAFSIEELEKGFACK